MKVKAVCNLGTNDYPDHPLLDGQVAEVPDQVGRRMVANRHATEIETPKPAVVIAAEPEPETPAQLEPKPTAKPAVSNSKGK